MSCRPGTHEQNGVAERKIRQMVDTGLALLADGKFHFSIGTLVFSTAAYLINRMLLIQQYLVLLKNYPIKHLSKSSDALCTFFFGPTFPINLLLDVFTVFFLFTSTSIKVISVLILILTEFTLADKFSLVKGDFSMLRNNILEILFLASLQLQ
jgi:hypothetical protein